MPCPPSCVKCPSVGRIDEEADLVAADIRVLVEAREEGEQVHLHRDLAGLEGIEAFLHVGVGHAGRACSTCRAPCRTRGPSTASGELTKPSI